MQVLQQEMELLPALGGESQAETQQAAEWQEEVGLLRLEEWGRPGRLWREDEALQEEMELMPVRGAGPRQRRRGKGNRKQRRLCCAGRSGAGGGQPHPKFSTSLLHKKIKSSQNPYPLFSISPSP